MRDIYEKQSSSSPGVSNYASSSGLSGDDKEIGYRATTSNHPYVLAKMSSIHNLPNKIDLNLARMVIVYTFNPSMCIYNAIVP
jgi:hypothetical protein